MSKNYVYACWYFTLLIENTPGGRKYHLPVRDFPPHTHFLSVFGINVERDVHLIKERNLNQHLRDHWESHNDFQMFGR